jgi:protein ImuB
VSLWLALRFPQLMIDALSAASNNAPLAVREQHRLVAVNAAATAQGLRVGMKIGTALALCDALQICERQPAAEQHWLEQQARALGRFTPMIALDDNCLLLEIGSSLRLFRGLDPLLSRLLRQLPASTDCHPGLGHTPLAAQILSQLPLADSRACIVLQDRQPELRVSRQQLLQLLARQSLDQLPLPASLKTSLQGPGLRTLGDLLALPDGALQRRFGKNLTDWLARLRGDKADLRQPIITPQRFLVTLEFDEPVSGSERLLVPMQQLLEQMQAWLIRHQQQVRAIRWIFFPLRGEPDRLLVRRAGGDHRAAAWLDLSRRHLEHTRLAAPALKLTLEAGRLLPMAAPPAHLFAALERPAARELLEKLANLPGLSLYQPTTADSHLPEQNEMRSDPLASQRTESFLSPSAFVDAPLWLLEQPLPLRSRQQQIFWRGAALELLPGLRQFNEPWWQPHQGWQRRYHIARHPLGIHCWLFQQGDTEGPWFLHGFF